MTLFVDIWMLTYQYVLGNSFFSAIHVYSGFFVFHLRVKEESSNTLVSFFGFACFLFVCFYYIVIRLFETWKIFFLGLFMHSRHTSKLKPTCMVFSEESNIRYREGCSYNSLRYFRVHCAFEEQTRIWDLLAPINFNTLAKYCLINDQFIDA